MRVPQVAGVDECPLPNRAELGIEVVEQPQHLNLLRPEANGLVHKGTKVGSAYEFERECDAQFRRFGGLWFRAATRAFSFRHRTWNITTGNTTVLYCVAFVGRIGALRYPR